jgi:hypothetical protein
VESSQLKIEDKELIKVVRLVEKYKALLANNSFKLRNAWIY